VGELAQQQGGDGRGQQNDRGPGERTEGRPPRGILVLLLLGALMLLLTFASRDGLGRTFGQKPLDLMEFERLLRRNEVAEVRFKDNQAQITLRPGNLRGEPEGTKHTVHFNSPEGVEAEIKLIRELAADDRPGAIGTIVHPEPSNALVTQLLAWFLPTLLLVALLYFLLFRQMRGPGSPGSLISFGKSRHRMAQNRTEYTLKDVAGIDEARQDIEEIIAFLKNPQKFSRLGGRMPKGVLLIGSPGCGKTLLAKATAGEAGVPFFSVSGSDFVEMFVGVGASRVRDLFEKAKESSPCIIFLDEVDAVGRRRGSGLGGGHDEREQTLNQILVEMDGFDTDRGIIVMAATNRPDILDPALLRPGRFDRQITIDMPDVAGREKILRVHARNKKLALDVDLHVLAKATPTFSGAELEALINEAALMAAMSDRESIVMHDLEEARDKIRWGRQKKSQKMLEKELRATAYHEAGHALVSAVIDECDPVHKVTIIPRGRALGLTMSLPDQDRYSMNKGQVLGRICMAYGGRIGEQLFTGELSTGASNDIEQASELARRMVTEWGMSASLGAIKYSDNEDTVFLGREINRHRNHSEATLQAIDAEVKRITEEQFKRAEALIAQHRTALERIAEALMTYETLNGEEVETLIAGRELRRRPVDPAPAPVAAPAPLPMPTPAPAPFVPPVGMILPGGAGA
jgi:cell division protease FtsH